MISNLKEPITVSWNLLGSMPPGLTAGGVLVTAERAFKAWADAIPGRPVSFHYADTREANLSILFGYVSDIDKSVEIDVHDDATADIRLNDDHGWITAVPGLEGWVTRRLTAWCSGGSDLLTVLLYSIGSAVLRMPDLSIQRSVMFPPSAGGSTKDTPCDLDLFALDFLGDV